MSVFGRMQSFLRRHNSGIGGKINDRLRAKPEDLLGGVIM